jgi:hypothetical protein
MPRVVIPRVLKRMLSAGAAVVSPNVRLKRPITLDTLMVSWAKTADKLRSTASLDRARWSRSKFVLSVVLVAHTGALRLAFTSIDVTRRSMRSPLLFVMAVTEPAAKDLPYAALSLAIHPVSPYDALTI